MNVDSEVAKQVQDDRVWKESRRRWASMGTKVMVGIVGAGLILSTMGAYISGCVKAEGLKPLPCKDSFGYNTAGRGYSEVTCAHPAHRMDIREIKKPTSDESGLFEIKCICDPRKAALLTCAPQLPAEIEKMYQGTVQEKIKAPEPVDDVTGAR